MASSRFPQRSFPTELLLIIFNFVFDELASYCADSQEAHRECAVCNSPYARPGSRKQRHVVWEWQDDVLSYALFPYSLAGVCRRWRDIMATVPQFWTRLIIFVDTPFSSLSPSVHSSFPPTPPPYPDAREIQSHLSWSAKLPIEVYVLRRRHSTSLGIDTSERARTRMIFEAVKPHLHRCHVLRFSVLQSSSLPSIVEDFEGVKAPVLTDLRLECEVDDQRDWDWEGGIPPPGADIPATLIPIPTPTLTAPTTTTTFSPHDNHIPKNPLQLPQRIISTTLTTTGTYIGRPRFWCPILSAISLNGRNFRDLSLAMRHFRGPSSRTRFQPQPQRALGASLSVGASASVIGRANGTLAENGDVMTLQHVEKMIVAHYSSPRCVSVFERRWGFGVEDLLEVVRRERMPRLEFLKLVDLDLSVGVGERVVELTPTHVVLEELAAEVVCALSSTMPVTSNSVVHSSSVVPSPTILSSSAATYASTCVRYVNEVESFEIIRSSLPLQNFTPEGVRWDIPDTCDLVLEEIENLGGQKSPIAGWRGNRLVCTGCNGFDDDFLAMLTFPSSSSPSQLIPSPTIFNAPNLQSLHLVSCINYSITSLKTLILTRNEALKSQFGRVRANVEDGPPCILEVVVEGLGPRGSRGEEVEEDLGEEDRKWFEERLVVFRWDVRGKRKGSRGRGARKGRK